MLTTPKQSENQSTKSTSSNGSFFGSGSSMPFFQAKLTVNKTGDAHEREADAVADQVMRMHEGDAPIVQRMPMRKSEQVQRKEGPCPEGFQKIERATWFNCGEAGARNLACAVCDNEKRNANCENLTRIIGHSDIIAPPRIGKCGDVFKITTPGKKEAEAIDVTLAERPGGTPLDIHDTVIPKLGLDIDTGRYTVCLKKTDRNDDRVIRAGTSKCT